MKLSSRIVQINRTRIFSGKDSLAGLENFRRSAHLDHKKVFILVDPVTLELCLPILLAKVPWFAGSKILSMPCGEETKTLETAQRLWTELLETKSGHDAMIISLGGGVVTDMGGFVAAGFHRGISCMHIPTTLLGQVDAAIGGKTGVNLGKVKNQVGFFYPPAAIFIEPEFLATLPVEQLRSGFAEIVKSALVGNAGLWHKLKSHPVHEIIGMPFGSPLWQHLVSRTISFKNQIITKDFADTKNRKILNFGHTVGHAIESYSHDAGDHPLLHGEAVAIGMICEAYLSSLKAGLPKEDLDEISTYIRMGFTPFKIDQVGQSRVLELMTHDKKNRNGQIMFSLLKEPGLSGINITCQADEISRALNFYAMSS